MKAKARGEGGTGYTRLVHDITAETRTGGATALNVGCIQDGSRSRSSSRKKLH